MSKINNQVTDAQLASIDFTLNSWCKYRAETSEEAKNIEYLDVSKGTIRHDNSKAVADTFVNEVLSKFNTSEKDKILITIDKASTLELIEEIVSSLLLYESPHARLILFIGKENFNSLSQELQIGLIESSIELYFNERVIEQVTVLCTYLKARASVSKYPFLHEPESIQGLFREGHRNFYGVIVDDECMPIADTCEPVEGFFDRMSDVYKALKLIVGIEKERKDAA